MNSETKTKSTDDRRTRRTKRMLQQGLSVLLLQKNIKDISVKELTDLVDLHRGTFYVHYRDIYDLYSSIQREVIEEVNLILDSFSPVVIASQPIPLILAMMNYIHDNADVCRMLLSDNGDRSFVESLSEIIRTRCLSDWLRIEGNAVLPYSTYMGCYIVAGSIGIIRRWVNGGMSESPEQIAHIIEQMTVPSISSARTVNS